MLSNTAPPPPPPPSLCRVELDRLWRCGERRASLRRACATRDHAQTAPPALPPPVTLRPARAPRPAGAMAEQRPRRRVCCGSQRRRARERRLGFRLRGGSRGATPPHDSHQGPPSPSHQPPPFLACPPSPARHPPPLGLPAPWPPPRATAHHPPNPLPLPRHPPPDPRHSRRPGPDRPGPNAERTGRGGRARPGRDRPLGPRPACFSISPLCPAPKRSATPPSPPPLSDFRSFS